MAKGIESRGVSTANFDSDNENEGKPDWSEQSTKTKLSKKKRAEGYHLNGTAKEDNSRRRSQAEVEYENERVDDKTGLELITYIKNHRNKEEHDIKNNSISSLSCFTVGNEEDTTVDDDKQRVLERFQDFNGQIHSVRKLEMTVSEGKSTKGKSYSKSRTCLTCGKRTRTICDECNEVHCYPLRNKDSIKIEDCCFSKHMDVTSSPKRKRLTNSAF